MPISAAFSTWSGVPPRTSARPAGRHRAGRPDLALAAHLGAGDGGVLLEQDADRAGGEQEPHDTVVGVGVDEVAVVVQDGRDDPGGAVRRRGDHPAAGGVLLVDRQRVEGDPLHRPQRVAAVVGGLEGLAQQRAARRRTLSPPGSTPVARMPRSTHSCMTDQMCSRPVRTSSSVRQDSSLASISSLMRSPVCRVRAQQFVAAAERVRDRRGRSSAVTVGARRSRPRRGRTRRRPSSTPGAAARARRRPSRVNRMPLEWNGSRLRRCSTRSSSIENAIGCVPASRSSFSSCTAATRGSAADGVDQVGLLALQAEHDGLHACRGRGRSRPASRTSRPARPRYGRAARRRPAGSRTCSRPASVRRCASSTARYRPCRDRRR